MVTFGGSQDIYYICTGLQLLRGSMQLGQGQLSISAVKPGRAQRLIMRQMRALTITPSSRDARGSAYLLNQRDD